MAGLGLVLAEAFSRYFMAVSPLKMHQIFMLALAKLRCVKTGGSGARCFAASPFGLPGFSSVVPRLHALCSMPYATFLPLHLNIAKKWASFGRTKN